MQSRGLGREDEEDVAVVEGAIDSENALESPL